MLHLTGDEVSHFYPSPQHHYINMLSNVLRQSPSYDADVCDLINQRSAGCEREQHIAMVKDLAPAVLIQFVPQLDRALVLNSRPRHQKHILPPD